MAPRRPSSGHFTSRVSRGFPEAVPEPHDILPSCGKLLAASARCSLQIRLGHLLCLGLDEPGQVGVRRPAVYAAKVIHQDHLARNPLLQVRRRREVSADHHALRVRSRLCIHSVSSRGWSEGKDREYRQHGGAESCGMRAPAQAMAKHFHFDLLPDSSSAPGECLRPHDPYPHGLMKRPRSAHGAAGRPSYHDRHPAGRSPAFGQVANAPITAAAGPEDAGRV